MTPKNRGFIEKKFTALLGTAFLLGSFCLCLPLVFHTNPRERLVHLSGHLGALRLTRGRIPEKNVFDLGFKEFPGINFHVENLSLADQQLLANIEGMDSLMKFAVERTVFQDALSAGHGVTLPLLELSSSNNVYIPPDMTSHDLAKGRVFFALVGLTALISGLVKGIPLIGAYRRHSESSEKEGEEKEPLDSLLISFAHNPRTAITLVVGSVWILLLVFTPKGSFRVIDGGFLLIFFYALVRFRPNGPAGEWLRSVLERESQRQLAIHASRVQTTAPKHVKAIQLLLKSGASIDMKNKHGQTPLHISASLGHVEAIDLLLRNGASVDLQDADGFTPVMLAAQAGFQGAVVKLVNAGAKVALANQAGETAIALAEKKKAAPIVEYLSHALKQENEKEKKAAAAAALAAAQGNEKGGAVD